MGLARFILLAVIAIATAVFAITAPANASVFTAPFSGANENPPNASTGTGTATVTIDQMAQTMLVEVDFSGLVSPTTIAHIHCCTTPDMNAGVASGVPTFPGFPAGVTSGMYSMSFDLTDVGTFNPAFVMANGGTAAGASAALIAGLFAGEAYFNIHTEMFMSGEIRANLAFVPLPAALWMFLAGAAGLGALRRRRLA